MLGQHHEHAEPLGGKATDTLEAQAMACVLDLRLDDALTDAVDRLPHAERNALPWLVCYAAMQQRIDQADYAATIRLAQAAYAGFAACDDTDGQARAVAEIAIARFHLGQCALALTELDASPPPTQPVCTAAVSLARYLNFLGTDQLPNALAAVQHGGQALDEEPNVHRRAVWRVVLLRNAVAAYHYHGQLDAARAAIASVLDLIDQHALGVRVRAWTFYEAGLLEQRAGQFAQALTLLEQARDSAEAAPWRHPLWRWIAVAQAHTLRDMGRLAAADEHYRLGGWGEGDNGPLWLWLLQERHAEARLAAEARLVAARATGSPVEVMNGAVLFTLLDAETRPTRVIAEHLRGAAAEYARLSFWHHHASVLLHLAAVEYDLGDDVAGDAALSAALAFGAAQGYLNFTWWHPQRMQRLLTRAVERGIEHEYSARLLHERGLDHVIVSSTDSPPDAVPQSIIIRCLGRFEVEIDGARLPAVRWQGQAAGTLRMQRLLLFLARHRTPQPVAAIARYIWADRYDTIDAAANVHVTLSGLRRVLEPDLPPGSAFHLVLATPDGYQLHPAIETTVDLDQFDAALHAARAAEAHGDRGAVRAAYEQIEQLGTGAFALNKPDPAEAEAYHVATMNALRWLAQDDLARSDLLAALGRAQRLVREDQWNHDGWRLLVEVYLAQGNRRTARRQYERYLKLQDEPDDAVLQLARMHHL